MDRLLITVPALEVVAVLALTFLAEDRKIPWPDGVLHFQTIVPRRALYTEDEMGRTMDIAEEYSVCFKGREIGRYCI